MSTFTLLYCSACLKEQREEPIQAVVIDFGKSLCQEHFFKSGKQLLYRNKQIVSLPPGEEGELFVSEEAVNKIGRKIIYSLLTQKSIELGKPLNSFIEAIDGGLKITWSAKPILTKDASTYS